ncbi:ABC transporter ATP-binding protein [Anaerococcus sp. AGMB00486]|uniref:ABC transporter ATP-binding protein n=1 Tax=Anaerococcus faecalis TaxID=2742993 RepID=A0ABX2NBE5_9FIRM|nr:ABC transporter ATP-binding protein [Anaerococcus faecalis]NVF12032.1 ABC transporter ATP-binding protein [Anaerococcus faecalis]
MTYAIEIKNLNKSYKNFSLKSINLRLEEGIVMGLIGENGAGKTTLIRSILGFTSYKGDIKIFGKGMNKGLKEDIGVVIGDKFFIEKLKLKKIDEVMNSFYKNWDSNYFFDLCKKLEIPDKSFKKLSAGNKVKLKIATALSHKPRLLILDEPTSGLDPIVRAEILDIFFDYIRNDGVSILFSTHITSDLEKIADCIAYISNGKLVFKDYKDDIGFKYGILKTSEDEIGLYDDKYFIKKRVGKYNIDVLIKDKSEFKELYPNSVVEKPSIEDIMLMLKRGI